MATLRQEPEVERAWVPADCHVRQLTWLSMGMPGIGPKRECRSSKGSTCSTPSPLYSTGTSIVIANASLAHSFSLVSLWMNSYFPITLIGHRVDGTTVKQVCVHHFRSSGRRATGDPFTIQMARFKAFPLWPYGKQKPNSRL